MIFSEFKNEKFYFKKELNCASLFQDRIMNCIRSCNVFKHLLQSVFILIHNRLTLLSMSMHACISNNAYVINNQTRKDNVESFIYFLYFFCKICLYF